jgi:PAS domain S-box-containing protein
MASDILELLADAPDGAYAVDMNQRIIFWNRGAERLLGYLADEVIGKRCYQVLGGLSEQEAPVCTSNCTAILWARSGQVAPAHTLLTHSKDGSPKWLSITHVLLPAARRELSSLIHIFHDASEEVEAKRVVQQLKNFLAAVPKVPLPQQVLPAETDSTVDALTPREREVLRLLSEGMGTKPIAEKLTISPTTVRNHIQRILAKLGVDSRLEGVVAASHRGLF